MKDRILQLWENLYSNYWFYPTLFAILGLILGFASGYIDLHYKQVLFPQLNWLYIVGPQGAREIFSVIAMSAITITSVSFSIGVLILSQASQQLGSRVLINFLKHNHTQIILGIFIGTFIFCLVNLRLIASGTDQQHFVPTFSLLLALFLGITIFFVLIYFINTISNFIQIDHVLTTIKTNLIKTIDRQFPKNKDKLKTKKSDIILFYNLFTNDAKNVLAIKSGYLQTIDHETLLDIATANDLIIKVLKRPGHFITESLPLFSVLSKKEIPSPIKGQLLECLGIHYRRSTTQDIEFAFEEFSEIAVRALSPAINDPYTAMNCLERMSVAFVEMSKYSMPPLYFKDKNGQVRVITNPYTYKGIVDVALDRLRQAARRDMSVSIKILEIIAKLGDCKLSRSYKAALLQQADLTYQGCQLEVHLQNDLNKLEKCYQQTKLKFVGN